MRERRGEKVGKNCMVEQCLHSDSQCGCKSAASLWWEKVLGSIMQGPWNQIKERLESQLEQQFFALQVQETGQASLADYPQDSCRELVLSGALQACSHSPAEEAFKAKKHKVEPLGTGVDTHTHTVPLCGARAKNLNSYLKSLRNKRKKHRKSSAKRAREKGRCRKK